MIANLLNLFRKTSPKYTQCLHHRTWLSRQVQEELLKKEAEANLSIIRKEENWYSKYL